MRVENLNCNGQCMMDIYPSLYCGLTGVASTNNKVTHFYHSKETWKRQKVKPRQTKKCDLGNLCHNVISYHVRAKYNGVATDIRSHWAFILQASDCLQVCLMVITNWPTCNCYSLSHCNKFWSLSYCICSSFILQATSQKGLGNWITR